MSNTSLLLAGYDAWNRGDRDAWLELLDPEIEIETSGVFPDLAPDYHGRERAAKFWSQMLEPWDEFHIEVERIEEEGDIVAAGIRFRARGEDSGVEVDMRFGNGIRVRDGLAVQLLNRGSLRRAAGERPAAGRRRRELEGGPLTRRLSQAAAQA
jgi:ketosteroid isomerase-like protein